MVRPGARSSRFRVAVSHPAGSPLHGRGNRVLSRKISEPWYEVMKVLTVIATIFIPITFIAGVYGMNLEFMPETKWPWSYPIAILAMAGVAGGMLAYFRKKRWL